MLSKKPTVNDRQMPFKIHMTGGVSVPLVYYVSDLEKNGTLDAERLLRLLGVSGKLSGFYYAVYMLEQVREKPECILLITKRLYRQTAQFFHTSSGCVERNLRTLVQACWRQPDHGCACGRGLPARGRLAELHHVRRQDESPAPRERRV